jgi:hypothetical protein
MWKIARIMVTLGKSEVLGEEIYNSTLSSAGGLTNLLLYK